MTDEMILFPFVRVVGQEKMKRALILNMIDPNIGGVLIRGEKGTAKSTTVRSLNQILPDVETSSGCQFHCDARSPRNMCDECRAKYDAGKLESEKRRMKVVELPLNVTEDRISGSLDIEHILRTGQKKFEGGVLAQANCNLLYVDEVNLLDDHIVDLLLDSAAMGRNYIEREGISFSHPSKFVLVGTMNPEEGNIRPQLLDRFGMSVDIASEHDILVKREIILRRLAFDADPEGYTASCQAETDDLRRRIAEARERLTGIDITNDAVDAIARITLKFNIEGHRADLAMIRAAKANAAFLGHSRITKDDIEETAMMVLGHRIKSGPFDEAEISIGDLKACLSGM